MGVAHKETLYQKRIEFVFRKVKPKEREKVGEREGDRQRQRERE